MLLVNYMMSDTSKPYQVPRLFSKLEPGAYPTNFDDSNGQGRQVDDDNDADWNDKRRHEQRVWIHPARQKSGGPENSFN